MALSNIKYKSFKFPNNPETTGFKCDRAYIKHKYPGLVGNELEDFGANAIVITGSGYFFGKNAYSTFRKLYAEYKKKGVGDFSHPIFTQVTRGLMTNLEGKVDAEKNAIYYSFEIVADTKPKTTENKSKKKNKGKNGGKSSDDDTDFKVGDIVYFKGGTHYYTSYKNAKGYKATAGWARITIIKEGHAHPYHLIHTSNSKSNVYGWVNAGTFMRKKSSKSSSGNGDGGKSGKVVHIVKKGECLSVICTRYAKKYKTTISWRTIAKRNNIKNPNLIYPGQKITIYY